MSEVKKLLADMEAFKEGQRKLTGPLLEEAIAEALRLEREARSIRSIPKSQRSLCGARTRAGGVCQAPALHGSERCRRHGGRTSTFTRRYRKQLREEAAYLRVLVSVCRALMW